jgi:hypothetical protein
LELSRCTPLRTTTSSASYPSLLSSASSPANGCSSVGSCASLLWANGADALKLASSCAPVRSAAPTHQHASTQLPAQ